MQTEQFTLFQCWKNERIDQVINKEAASVDTATFLATHLPLNKMTYHGPQSINAISEEGFLQELKYCAEQDRHAFTIVQGVPGSGKSHLIRWLKESYATEADQHERVLFVERAQSSLRSTLEQIIQSGIFDKEAMKEQLEKLNGARIELSKEALSSTLLSQLHVAINEVQQAEMPRWLAKKNRLEKYLLDFVVRRELTKVGGPIDRIMGFLRSGLGKQNSQVPNFEDSDFIFKAPTLREIDGYEEAKYVAEHLQGEERAEERHELASYLNQLLPFAIGHATALTSDDFKQIFYDLRRHLRQQKQTLILFIEDITALTGIDTGLIDVLATQHLGESNREFCRITSVIGITDNYFMDYFPDNMKDRVTHRLILNAAHAGLSDAELLNDSNTTADLAARYLNAMRLEKQELDEWLRQGGKPSRLPNACTTCIFKTTCHTAFGTRKIQTGDESQQDIGLYPFNQKALWTLYQHLNTANTRRTPRSLLHNILHYVMQSHGSKIRDGLFPPESSELGGEFTTFSLAKMQRNVILSQGGADARRIETLVMIWGNGTIDANEDGEHYLVGSLPQAVFQAFGIRLIQGERLATPVSTTTQQRNTTGSLPVQSPLGTVSTRAREIIAKDPLEPNRPRMEQQKKYIRDITDWSNGGRLIYYAEYRELLVPLIRSFIDWDFYHISDRHLDEALKPRRIQIQRQEGKMNAAHYLTLNYSDELMAVLLGLVSLKEDELTLEDAVLSGCLSSFSAWLYIHEAEIVRYVQQPHHSVSNILPLDEMVLFTCLIMACLQGDLQLSYNSTQDLWLDVVNFCVTTRNSPTKWERLQQNIVQQHSRIWSGLVKRITSQTASSICSLFLSIFNCAQGNSNDVKFLDAPRSLQALKRLQSKDWQLPITASLDATAISPWGEVVATYAMIQNQFESALKDDCAAIEKLLVDLSTFIGDSSPKDVFQAIQMFAKNLGDTGRGSFSIKRQLNATQFIAMQTKLHVILKEQKQERLALLLSNVGETYLQAQEYLSYFEAFRKEATRWKDINITILTRLQSQISSESMSKQEEIHFMYRETADILDMRVATEESV